MIGSKFNLKNYIRKKHLINSDNKKLSKSYKKIFQEVNLEIENPKKTLNIFSKKFKFNFNFKDLKKFRNFEKIALIGMGGSILGAAAIYGFFGAKVKKKIFFFDNLDEDKIKNFKKKEKLSNILFIIISKSGNTIETLTNFFSINIIKKKPKNIIAVSEKRNSELYSLSKKFNLFHIEHRQNIGGRYSVLSEVGIIPAYLMGINIFKLRSKILDCINYKNKSIMKESTIKLYDLMKSKKYNNLILLNYSPELEKFLFWYQQLISESLGKKGKGFLPMISTCPKDHHSLLQLYLDGPKDKIFYIFSVEKKIKRKIIFQKEIKKENLYKNDFTSIKNAQKKALIKVLQKKNIPFREFKIKSINEETLGVLFSYFIFETAIIGKLLNINPYNQPAVEQVKIYTKKLLN